MAPTQGRESKPQVTSQVSAADYAAFIRQIELKRIWLVEATLANRFGPEGPKNATVNGATSAEWTATGQGFRVLEKHDIHVVDGEGRQVADISVTFGLDWESAAPMSDAIFAIFKEANLPVNTWPYLREFVSSTTGRMYWSHFQLPTFKLGTGEAKKAQAPPGEAKAKPPRRQARKTS